MLRVLWTRPQLCWRHICYLNSGYISTLELQKSLFSPYCLHDLDMITTAILDALDLAARGTASLSGGRWQFSRVRASGFSKENQNLEERKDEGMLYSCRLGKGRKLAVIIRHSWWIPQWPLSLYSCLSSSWSVSPNWPQVVSYGRVACFKWASTIMLLHLSWYKLVHGNVNKLLGRAGRF